MLNAGDVLNCSDAKDTEQTARALTTEGYSIAPDLQECFIRVLKPPIVSASDRITLHNAEKVLMKLAGRMRSAKISELVFREDRDDYTYTGGKYGPGYIESIARALYEIEKAKEEE